MSSNPSNEDPRRKKPSPAGRGGMTPHQLRQRRTRILKDKASESQGEREWQETAQKGQETRNYYMTKFYVVFFTALVVTIVAILNHTRPSFLFKRRKAQPPMYLATIYPPNVVMERDLPRFFQTYSIATPNNKDARRAAIKVANSRRALKEGTGSLKVVLKAWDSSNIDLLLQRNVCGKNFEDAYRSSSQQRQDDLLMWCLLTTRITEGFFLESVEMIDNAFITARKRGMMVRKADESSSEEEGTGRISNAYYLHPRLPGEEEAKTAPIPAMVLGWLLNHPENDLSDPSKSLQEAIYDAVSSMENGMDRYILLDEVCQATQPRRAIGKHCTNGPTEECCFFVVPEAVGGNVGRNLEDEEEIASQRQSLREGVKEDDDKKGSSM